MASLNYLEVKNSLVSINNTAKNLSLKLYSISFHTVTQQRKENFSETIKEHFKNLKHLGNTSGHALFQSL